MPLAQGSCGQKENFRYSVTCAFKSNLNPI